MSTKSSGKAVKVIGSQRRQSLRSVSPAGPFAESWFTKKNLYWMLAIAILTFIVLSPSLKNGFTNWDDNLYVTDNPLMGQLDRYHLKEFLTEDFVGNYHPLTMLSLAVDYELSGGKPGWFHFTNLFLHLLNTVLVFILAWKFSRGNRLVAGFSALVFGIHPMHVESVAWISERKDVLYTFFFLLATNIYVEFHKRRTWLKYLAAFFFFVLACLSKSAAVVLPVVLILLDLYLDRITWRNLLEKVPFVVVSVIIGLKALETQAEFKAISEISYFTLPERIRFASYGFVIYLVKFFAPYNLSAYHYYPMGSVPLFYSISIGLVMLLFAGAIWIYRRDRTPLFGLLFYTITIALVLQFITLGNAIIAERYTYVPYIGVAFVVGMYLFKRPTADRRPPTADHRPPTTDRRPPTADGRPLTTNQLLLYTFAILFLIAMAVIANQRTQVWKDGEALWTDVINKYPDRDMGWVNRGHHRRSVKQYDESLEDYAKAISLNPNNYRAYHNRGKIYFDRGEVDLALSDINNSIRLNPDYAEAYANRGAVYAMKQETDKALEDLNKALELDPTAKDTYFNRANLYYQNQQIDKAMQDVNTFLFMSPDDPDGHNLRGLCYLMMGQVDQADQEIGFAIRRFPGNPRYYLSRAYIWLARSEFKKALDDVLKSKEMGMEVDDGFIDMIREQVNAAPSAPAAGPQPR